MKRALVLALALASSATAAPLQMIDATATHLSETPARPTSINGVQFGYRRGESAFFDSILVPGVGWIAMPGTEDDVAGTVAALDRAGHADLVKLYVLRCKAASKDDVERLKSCGGGGLDGAVGFSGSLATVGPTYGDTNGDAAMYFGYTAAPARAYAGTIDGPSYPVATPTGYPSSWNSRIDLLQQHIACVSACSGTFGSISLGCTIVGYTLGPQTGPPTALACSLGAAMSLRWCTSGC